MAGVISLALVTILATTLFVAIYLLQLGGNKVAAIELSCQDENGAPVDWYIGYKFPKINEQDKFKSGYAYAYFTSAVNHIFRDDGLLHQTNRDDSSGLPTKSILRRRRGSSSKRSTRAQPNVWSLSKELLDDPGSVIMRTLSIAYDKSYDENINKIFYNDDPPLNSDGEQSTKTNNRRAHAKGVLLLDEDSGSGVWLTHSVPQFPPTIDQKLRFNSNSIPFGQTFMCINFDIRKSGKQIVDHLVNMRPLVYEHKISEQMYNTIPDLKQLDLENNMKYKKYQEVPKLTQVIETKGGQKLSLFSKSRLFNDDMYSGWIDYELNSPLYVETWRRGAGNPLNSYCPRKGFHVNNIIELKYSDEISWKFSRDHSKWAISDELDTGTVCIGDQNRMESQFKRGGGAVCIKCSACWGIFSNTIKDTEPCPVKPSDTTTEAISSNMGPDFDSDY